jgi:hypothetical protein
MANNRVTAIEKKWDAGILRSLDGQCMKCGCPKDNYHMKVSTSPYECATCQRKQLGDDEFMKRMEMVAFVQDEIFPLGDKAIFAYVKRTLTHGFSLDPIKLDQTAKGESDGTEGRTERTPIES